MCVCVCVCVIKKNRSGRIYELIKTVFLFMER